MPPNSAVSWSTSLTTPDGIREEARDPGRSPVENPRSAPLREPDRRRSSSEGPLGGGSEVRPRSRDVEGKVVDAEDRAKIWLATDQPDGAFDRQPLHWPLVFPEVFDPGRPGFDAIIGNPPFLGGQKITGSLGTAYRECLVEHIGHGVRGSADLIAYFLLRVHDLLNWCGQTGLIATNTLAQGDTREVGLDQIVASGTEIRQAVKSAPWPSKGAALEYRCCLDESSSD